MSPDAHASLLASLAARLHEERGETLTSQAVVARTGELLPSAEHVSITVRNRRKVFRTLAASSATAEELDRLQYALLEGPCLEAATEHGWLRSGEVGRDQRWPVWGPRAGELGAGSLLSVCLLARGEVFGALNMYAGERGRFSHADEVDTALLWADHAAAALAHEHKVNGLETAMASRHVIGMAQGIVMERFGLDEERSFALLTRLSSARNEKVRDVAAEVVRTRELPRAELKEHETAQEVYE